MVFLRYGYVRGKDPPVIIPSSVKRERVRNMKAAHTQLHAEQPDVCAQDELNPVDQSSTSSHHSVTCTIRISQLIIHNQCLVSVVLHRRFGCDCQHGEGAGETRRASGPGRSVGELPVHRHPAAGDNRCCCELSCPDISDTQTSSLRLSVLQVESLRRQSSLP